MPRKQGLFSSFSIFFLNLGLLVSSLMDVLSSGSEERICLFGVFLALPKQASSIFPGLLAPSNISPSSIPYQQFLLFEPLPLAKPGRLPPSPLCPAASDAPEVAAVQPRGGRPVRRVRRDGQRHHADLRRHHRPPPGPPPRHFRAGRPRPRPRPGGVPLLVGGAAAGH